jgi:hypothetical protein
MAVRIRRMSHYETTTPLAKMSKLTRQISHWKTYYPGVCSNTLFQGSTGSYWLITELIGKKNLVRATGGSDPPVLGPGRPACWHSLRRWDLAGSP